MKVLQINVAVNTTSTGKIAERIGVVLTENGEQSVIAYGRKSPASQSTTIKIGTDLDIKLHGLKTRLLDKHAFGSTAATKKLVTQIQQLNPDVIHLHNLHGYYINIKVLFDYLKQANKPIVWTLHDCWPFTGHCSYFSFVKCDKWKTQCHHCPLCKRYPESFFIDNSFSNFNIKKELFNGLPNMTLVTPSHWLKNLLKESFLQTYPVHVIHNGIDVHKFIPTVNKVYKNKIGIQEKNILLGVASIWDRRKGLNDFLKLAAILPTDDIIVLVGLPKETIKTLPQNIVGIERTESLDELVALYSMATAFINPTWVDNFPTTNIEALATGTPVITYNTGGSIEAIDEHTGFIVPQGDIEGIVTAFNTIKQKGKQSFSQACRQRAVSLFNEKERFTDYYHLYKEVIGTNVLLQTIPA
jgi:putative colanic acid biosynthesis glycosyltransferase